MVEDAARARSLATVLSGFQAFDAVEEGYSQQMLELLRTPERAFRRDHFEPGHVTGSMFVLDAEGQSLLMLMHRKLGRWLQPGGHVEPADVDVAATARREALEETGLDLPAFDASPFDLDIHEIGARGAEPTHLHLDVRYLVRVERQTARLSSESLAARWCPLAELRESPGDAGLARVLAKLDALVRGR